MAAELELIALSSLLDNSLPGGTGVLLLLVLVVESCSAADSSGGLLCVEFQNSRAVGSRGTRPEGAAR